MGLGLGPKVNPGQGHYSMGFKNERKAHFPCEFPYGFDSSESSLSSPVESNVGSTETESDDDDYMVGSDAYFPASIRLPQVI